LYTRTGGVGIAGKYRALEQKIPPKSKEGFDPQGLKRRFDNTNMAKPWGEIRRGERKKSPNMGTSRDTRRALEQKIPKIQRIKRQTYNTKHIQTHVNYENLQRIKDIGGDRGGGAKEIAYLGTLRERSLQDEGENEMRKVKSIWPPTPPK